MSNDVENNDQVWFRTIIGLNLRNEYIPLAVGTLLSFIVIILLLIVYILWRFLLTEKEKFHGTSDNLNTINKTQANDSSYPAVILNSSQGQYLFNSRIVELIPEHENTLCQLYKNCAINPKSSDCVETGQNVHNELTKLNSTKNIQQLRRQSIILSPINSCENYSLPQISQFCAYPLQYKSINFDHFIQESNYASFRTRSLPSYVRFKKHSLTTVDSAAELYDKVNFSKKRKNRMRKDEAAIIALSKSRSQFFNKDTDSLVDNEAVIVYDERTAL